MNTFQLIFKILNFIQPLCPILVKSFRRMAADPVQEVNRNVDGRSEESHIKTE